MKRKKILTAGLVVLVACMLSGCGTDDDHATVEITTKAGRTMTACSFNSSGNIQGKASAIENGKIIEMEDENDIAYVHFYCASCGYDESYELSPPFAKILECDCAEDVLFEPKREYFAIISGSYSATEATEETD